MEEKNLILAVDVGTTETKAVIVAPDGYIDSRQMSCTLSYPEGACVEQSPDDLANAVYGTSREVLAAHPECLPRLAGITFTSQMQNTIPLGGDGRPLMNAMSWMDQRAACFVNEEMFRGLVKIEGYPVSKLLKFLRITGGMPGKTGKDTVCKIAWLRKHRPELYEATHRFLDVKDYAVFLATGNFVTSYDMAYVTWLMNTSSSDQGKWHWSGRIHRMFGLDPGKMPELRASTAVVGKVTEEFSGRTGVPAGLPVVNGSGDLLTSAIGSGAIQMGRIHVNIGTAGWVATHHPKKAIDTAHYVGTTAAGIPGIFLVVSKQETLGATLDWVKGILYPERFTKGMSAGDVYADLDREAAQSPPGAHTTIITPWLFGERSPINNPYLRGQIFNIGMNTVRADLLRAAMEGVAFNIRWGMEFVERLSLKKSRPETREIRLIGGASKSEIWCRIFADVFQRPVVQMMNPQMACALGAATIGMVSLGIYRDFTDVERMLKKGNTYEPDPGNEAVYDRLFGHYKALYANNKKDFNKINR
ncbi:MAG: FGGY-family carbohydrate kinase [Spirochaetes bacterium]|nr:FGGY-family carbohydrate kinase [Spirochaetota bacterium]